MKRRLLLQAAVSATQLGALLAAGLIPRRLLAAWPTEAFHAEQIDEAERALLGDRPIEDTDRITIEAAEIAEDGRVVPITVHVELAPPFTLVLLADKNPTPLLARAHFEPGAVPSLAIRAKLAESGRLIAIADSGTGLLRATRPIKVTAGGCGS